LVELEELSMNMRRKHPKSIVHQMGKQQLVVVQMVRVCSKLRKFQ
jgi:hypothetical protein